MADAANSARDCAFQTLALSTLGADPVWDARLTEYLSALTLVEADSDFGLLARTGEANTLKVMEAEHAFGPNWRSIPKALVLIEPSRKAAQDAESLWSDKYCEPFWQAGRALALTPAPTIAAALLKTQVIKRDELDNDSKMTRDPFEIVAEDMARLANLTSADEKLEAAWQHRRETIAAYNAAPNDDDDDTGQAKAENDRLWAMVSDDEIAIHSATASTLAGVKVQLWLALDHCVSDKAACAHAAERDLAWFMERDRDMDWNGRLVLAALHSLETMGA